MSSFDNQRAPNVSEFIANLNAIPSAQDLAAQQDFNFDDDLAMFTNTTFFDFDLGHSADLQPQADLRFSEDAAQYGQQTVEPLEAPDMAKANMDFLQGELFIFLWLGLCFARSFCGDWWESRNVTLFSEFAGSGLSISLRQWSCRRSNEPSQMVRAAVRKVQIHVFIERWSVGGRQPRQCKGYDAIPRPSRSSSANLQKQHGHRFM